MSELRVLGINWGQITIVLPAKPPSGGFRF